MEDAAPTLRVSIQWEASTARVTQDSLAVVSLVQVLSPSDFQILSFDLSFIVLRESD